MIPGGASARRRMRSSVQPTVTPSARTGNQLVTASTRSAASTASSIRTCGSSTSSSPPRVNPISGRPLPADHSADRARTCSRTAAGAAD